MWYIVGIMNFEWMHNSKKQLVTMVDRDSAERAVKDANPIIDGRKANVNLAYLGAKPRNGFIQSGFPFSSLRNAASAGAAAAAAANAGTYATFPNSTSSPFGPGSQFGAAAAAFYLNGPTTNGFLTGVITPSSTGAYLTDTRI
ncbi:hypothetical protein BLOT_002899 [Blomia tropicalis]|nr:hypothetical protein BLOT_002899 [Blomia tropicalis]